MMEIVHSSYTLTDPDNNSKKTLIEFLNLKEDEKVKKVLPHNEIMFELKGKCIIHFGQDREFSLEARQGVFFAAGAHFDIHSQEESTMIIIRLDPFQKIGGCYSISDLYKDQTISSSASELTLLPVYDILWIYLENLSQYLKDGLDSMVFCEIKIKELFFIFSNYYKKEVLSDFFSPVLSSDVAFASFVLKNWHQVKNAKELSERSFYCQTSFGKKFKKVFGVTPYKWLNDRRLSQIYYELTNGDKPLKSIAEEFYFNSQQNFNSYCMRYFKETPGMIRSRKNIKQ